MGWVIAAVAGFLIGGCAVAALYAGELRRMAGFLRDRPAGSNARLTVTVPGRAPEELAAAVNAQLDAIQDERIEGMQRTEEFRRDLSALAHDVRTPLMGARGHIQLALDGMRGNRAGAGEDARHLEAALGRLDDMRMLLDQLFAYARANDPDSRSELEPVAVHPLLAEILLGHYPEFEERGWEPTVRFEDESLTVDADRAALGRILENLTSNALRYGAAAPSVTQTGPRVTFSNEVDAATAKRLDVGRMFRRFYQADGARSGNGSGLGLAVARSLAESMGMTLSASLDGTTLSVTLAMGHGTVGDAARTVGGTGRGASGDAPEDAVHDGPHSAGGPGASVFASIIRPCQ